MLSVVIPTRDRRPVLLETLSSLERQRSPEGGFEVIVVDNGSTDGTRAAVSDLIADTAMSLRLVSEPRPGPSRARNAGIAAAAGELVLFLGDDTAPASTDLLARHEQLHRERQDWRYAIQGKATWTPQRPITPLMEWLEESGFQFNFNQLPTGRVDPVGSFCTAHASVKRQLLERSGEFDVRFPWAAVEDVELSVRFERLGVELDYRPELLVLHDHPTTLASSLDRQRRIGRSAALLHVILPGWDRRELPEPQGLRWRLLRWTGSIWRLIARLGLPGAAQPLIWKGAHLSSYASGYRDGAP